MKKKISFIIFYFCCINAQAQYEFVFKQPYPQRANSIDSLYTDLIGNWKTGSVDVLTTPLKKMAKAANDEKALLQIELGLVLMKMQLGSIRNYDMLHASLDSIIIAAKKTNNNFVLARAYSEEAVVGIETKQYTAMFDAYLNMLTVVKDLTQTEYYPRNYSLYTAALYFYRFRDRKSVV